jgi:hypothetical protein
MEDLLVQKSESERSVKQGLDLYIIDGQEYFYLKRHEIS